MATQRIFLVENAGLADHARQALALVPDAPELVALDDGAKCLGAFVKLLHAGKGPLLLILDDPLPRIGGRGTALAVRAIERAVDAKPTAILFYSDGPSNDELKAVLSNVTRAVHLQRKPSLSEEDQAKRFANAIGRLLAQVRGKS